MRTVSAASVLAARLLPDDIRERIVVVGATVPEAVISFPTPFDSVMAGGRSRCNGDHASDGRDGMLRDQLARLVDAIIGHRAADDLVGLPGVAAEARLASSRRSLSLW